MSAFAAPITAIVFGAFILCAETCLHWSDIVNSSHWTDLPLHDWLAGGLLIFGGAVARRGWRRGHMYQAAGWGFMSSLLVGALIGHWSDWSLGSQPTDDWISEGAFLGVLAVLTLISVVALTSTLTVRD